MFWIALALLAIILALAALALREYLFTRSMAAKALGAVPSCGKFVTISTGKLHYLSKGTGPDVLLIHGLSANLRHFDMGVIDALATSYRVTAIHRPGAGYSDRPDEAPANLLAQAGYVHEAIAALGLDKPLVVGHSLGGGIGLCLGLEHPEDTRGLALIAPICQPPHASIKAFEGMAMPAALRKPVSWLAAARATIKNRDANLAMVFGPEEVPPSFALRAGGILGLVPRHFQNMAKDYASANEDIGWMVSNYDRMQPPVHILTGDHDQILPAEHQALRLQAAHPQFRVEVIAGGHMLPATQPEATVDFIRRSDPGAA